MRLFIYQVIIMKTYKTIEEDWTVILRSYPSEWAIEVEPSEEYTNFVNSVKKKDLSFKKE